MKRGLFVISSEGIAILGGLDIEELKPNVFSEAHAIFYFICFFSSFLPASHLLRGPVSLGFLSSRC